MGAIRSKSNHSGVHGAQAARACSKGAIEVVGRQQHHKCDDVGDYTGGNLVYHAYALNELGHKQRKHSSTRIGGKNLPGEELLGKHTGGGKGSGRSRRGPDRCRKWNCIAVAVWG